MSRHCEQCGDPTQESRRRFCSRKCSAIAHTMTIEQFWATVDQRGDDECWPWLGSLHSAGYGRHGGTKYAHRTVLALSLGREIRGGFFACHTCDNPPCCNPAHLFEGTSADNAQDMARKGRVRGGMPKGMNQHVVHRMQRSSITGVR